MKTKFTKGKWEKKSNNIFFGKELISTAYHRNGYKKDMYGNYEKCEGSEANALLISKAPEMFEMLEKWSILNPEHYKDLAGFINETKQLLKEATEL